MCLMTKRGCEGGKWIPVSKVGSREHRNETTCRRIGGNLAT